MSKNLSGRSILIAICTAVVSFSALGAESVDAHLNTPWPLGDVLKTKPISATARPNSSCKTAEIYVSRIDAGRGSEIGELFAEDGVFLPPNASVSDTLKGREAINAWFSEHAKAVKQAIPLSFIDAGPECFMEIAGMLSNNQDGQLHLTAIDHFTMNAEGKIIRAVYYFRPDTIRAVDAIVAASAQKQ
jgi:hypothetical protein